MKLDQEAAATFYRTRAAWLLPDGTLRPAPAILEHLSALRDTPWGPMVARMEAEVAQIQNDIWETLEQEEQADPNAHPAMHRFDGLADAPRERLVRELYGAGLIRLGLRVDRAALRRMDPRDALADPESNTLEAEGLAEHVDAADRTLERLARLLGTECRRIRYAVSSVRRRGRQPEECLERVPDEDPSPRP